MASESGKNERRIDFSHWEGVNAIVDKNLAKRTEFLHVENGRSKIVGTIEKREGQVVLGTGPSGEDFLARENYDLAFVSTGNMPIDGLYRLTAPGAPNGEISDSLSMIEESFVLLLSSLEEMRALDLLTLTESITLLIPTLFISVSDDISVGDSVWNIANGILFVSVFDTLTTDEPDFNFIRDRSAFYLDNTDDVDVNIYRLDEDSKWMIEQDPDAHNIAAADFSHTIADGKLFLVNGRAYNRYISKDGETVVTSQPGDPDAGRGHLHNSPRAKLINLFKDRLYLANYDYAGVHYGNTVLQSSPPVGILALVNDDVTNPTDIDTESAESFYIDGVSTDISNSSIAAYYKLDGDATDSKWDADLTNNNETPFVGGRINQGADLGTMNHTRGAHDSTIGRYFVGTNDLGIDGDQITLSAWFKMNVRPAAGEDHTLVVQSNDGTHVRYVLKVSASVFSPYDLSVTITRFKSASGSGVGATFDYDNEWHHAVGVYDTDGTDNLKIYIDGVYRGTTTTTGSGAAAVYDGVSIGASVSSAGTPSDFAALVVDEVGIWNTDLSLADIQTLYNSGAALSYGFPSQWKIPVTDTSYFYTETYSNEYEVWRVNTKIADIVVSSIDDLYIYLSSVTWADGEYGFESQDQIYPAGTVFGEKRYLWPNNPTLLGQDVKQYGTFKLSGSDESDITLLDNIGNVMVIANRSNLATWNGSALNNFDIGVGCPSSRGHIKAYGALYFIHYTGVYATSGTLPTIISSPVQSYIDGATKEGIENAVVGKKGRSIFFCIGDVTLYRPDGSVKRTLRDTCLEYNILQQTWYVHTNVKATAFETAILSASADVLTLTDGDSKDVKTFLDGNTDDGEEIIFRVDSQPFPIAANMEDLSNPELVIVESERGSSMQAFIALDGGEFFQIEGKIEKGVSKLRIHDKDVDRGSPPVGHYMAVSFRDSSKQICKLARVAVTFVPAGVGTPT